MPALVDPTGKAGNYAVTLNNGTLTITPAALAIAANNATRLYGDANPTFTATFTGLRNADNITASFTTAATPASAVGAFLIVPAPVDPTNKLGNYTVTLNNGTLTVSPAPLTVTATSGASSMAMRIQSLPERLWAEERRWHHRIIHQRCIDREPGRVLPDYRGDE